jgi:Zn-dependent protease with chaperone function
MKSLKLILIYFLFPIHLFSQSVQYSIPATVNKPFSALKPSGFNLEVGKQLILKDFVQDPTNGLGYTIICDGTVLRISKSDLKKITIDKPIDLAILWQIVRFGSDLDESINSKGYQYDLRKNLEEETFDMTQNIQTYYGLFEDEYLEDYVQRLLYQIHPITLDDGRPGNLSVKIIKSINHNAFCTSSGLLFLTTGLLSTIRSEDELVGILAHEVAHFVLDHQIVNINKAITRQKRAEFWSGMATITAATVDAYLATQNDYYVPGILTYSTAILSYSIANSINERIGTNYNQSQELEADNAAKMVLECLHREPRALSATLSRIKEYCLINGDYLSLSGSGTHPGLDERINRIGNIDPATLNNLKYDRLISGLNTFNAGSEFYLKHITTSLELVNRNIDAGVGIEDDYLIKAMAIRLLNDTPEKNLEALDLINKAKSLNIVPTNYIFKQEGITLLRLGRNQEASVAFKTYLGNLENVTEISENLKREIEWTKIMIYKVNLL